MDTAWMYGDPDTNDRVVIYAPPEYRVSKRLELRIGDTPVTFWLITGRELTCEPAVVIDPNSGKASTVKCGNWECHRRELGVCQCGLHPDGVDISWT